VGINVFRRRDAAPSLATLLANYLVRAQAIAEAGGGHLWVVEPSLAPELMPEITEAVQRCLADYGIATDGVAVIEGTASARIAVIQAGAVAEAEPPAAAEPLVDAAPLAPAAPLVDVTLVAATPHGQRLADIGS
jgi:hypothetical protein